METQGFDVALTETPASPSICDAKVHLKGFQIYWAQGKGGWLKRGVAIYLKNYLAVDTVKIEIKSDGYVE